MILNNARKIFIEDFCKFPYVFIDFTACICFGIIVSLLSSKEVLLSVTVRFFSSNGQLKFFVFLKLFAD